VNRRTFVASSGIAVAGLLGGCLGESGDSSDTGSGTDEEPSTTPTPTETPTDPTETPSGTDVTVSDIAVRKAVEYESLMGSGGVLAGNDRQYVVASVRVPKARPEPEFRFENDDQSWKPGLPDTHGANNAAVAGHGGGPVGHSTGGNPSYLAFTVPASLSPSNPRIRFLGDGEATWPLPDAATDRLDESAPDFELDRLDAPETVSQGDSMTVSVAATNVSDVAGRFLAALYWPTERIADDDESHVVDRTVAAGESMTWSTSIDTERTAREAGSVSLRVEGHVQAERSVSVTDVEVY
jgi:hypothetical protein